MNILLSSVGRRSYLVHYFREALRGEGKIICTNCNPDTPGMFFADVARVVPMSAEPGFLEALLDVCREFRPTMLFSLHDVEISYIARAREKFLELGTLPVMPGYEFTELCLDKFACCRFAQQHGIPSCRTYLQVSEVLTAVEQGQIDWPVVVKPRFGFGSFGIEFVNHAGDLTARHRSLVEEVSQHRYLKQEKKGEDSVIMQEMLRGDEYGLDILCDLQGGFRTCLIERKLAMRSGETDAAEIVEDAKIFELGRQIAATMRLPGTTDVDVIVRDGVPHLLEINPRFGGHYPFAHVAGANVPAALIAWAQGNEPDPAWLQARVGAKAFKDIQLVRSCEIAEDRQLARKPCSSGGRFRIVNN